MLPTKLLAFIRCPEDRSELTVADEELVQRLNAAVRAGRINNRGGRTLNATIDGGLIRARGDVLYPIIHGIPVLLRDEAIAIDQIKAAGSR